LRRAVDNVSGNREAFLLVRNRVFTCIERNTFDDLGALIAIVDDRNVLVLSKLNRILVFHTNGYRCLRLDLVSVLQDSDVEEAGEGNLLGRGRKLLSRIVEVLLELRRSFRDLPNIKLCAVRDACRLIVGNRYGVGFPRCRNIVLADLRIGNVNAEHFTGIHGYNKRLVAEERSEPDKAPIACAKHRVVDCIDLPLGQIGAVLNLQVVLFLYRANRRFGLGLPHPNKIWIREAYGIDFPHEFACDIADFNVTVCNGVVARIFCGRRLRLAVGDA